MEIVLGSSSPRREMILKSIYSNLTIIPPSIDEDQKDDESPEDFAQRISYEKALDVFNSLQKINNETLLISADTVVTIDNKTLGKPHDYNEARDMLHLLSHRKHQVISGLTLIYIRPEHHIIESDIESTTVTFKSLTDNDIKRYLNLIHYKDKAGSYACQEHGDIIIESIEGSLSNVIGFPLRLYFRLLYKLGIIDKGI